MVAKNFLRHRSQAFDGPEQNPDLGFTKTVPEAMGQDPEIIPEYEANEGTDDEEDVEMWWEDYQQAIKNSLTPQSPLVDSTISAANYEDQMPGLIDTGPNAPYVTFRALDGPDDGDAPHEKPSTPVTEIHLPGTFTNALPGTCA